MTTSIVERLVPLPPRAGLLCLIGFLVGSAAALAQQPPELPPEDVQRADELRRDMRRMMALARDRVFPALVNIEVITVRYYGGKERKGRAVGSGTIISPEGYVLTNYHVAENGRKFKCTLADKQELTATLVGDDPLTDLAVLKLDLSELKDPQMPLPYARLGDSTGLQIGDTVMAMGSPWALSRSVTRGSVSNTERVLTAIDDEAGELHFDQDQRTGIFNRWIQHDAAINPGNSGGPLVNLRGEIVGVNARGSLFGGDMGFAIPSNIARTVAAELIEDGDVPRSWYGFSLKSIKKTGLDEGVLVNSVVDDGPADKAGIQAGDIILKIDDEPITVWYPEQIPPLLKELADREIGSTVRMVYMRDGETAQTELLTEELKRDRGDEAAFRAWGISAKEITERMARNRRLDRTDGVLVSGVRSGSSAQLAEPSLNGGDVIRAIDGESIKTLDDFIECYEEIMEREELPEYVLVEFDRRGKSHVTLLKPKPDKDVDPPREVAKAWIGVATQPVVKKLAKQLGHPDVLGFRITRVYPRTKAATSGLERGDIIVAMNGERLRPKGMQDAGLFQRRVRRLEIGDQATLTVLRHGQQLDLAVELERTRIEPSEARRDRNRDFELTVREVTFFDRDENRWDEDVRGVIVTDVESAGWASLGGIRPGDLIQRIDDHKIRGLRSYRRVMEAVTEAQPERVVFVVLRGVRTHFQYVEPDWKPTTGDEQGEQADKNTDDED
jgi:serine protease Do